MNQDAHASFWEKQCKKMKKLVSIVLISIVLISIVFTCSTNQVRLKMIGCWVIDDVVIENVSYPKGKGVLLLNILCLDKNGECQLPGDFYSHEDQYGTWKIIKKKNDFYLKIEHCEDNCYNTDYQIELDDNKASFTSKKMAFHCSFVHR